MTPLAQTAHPPALANPLRGFACRLRKGLG